MSKKVIRVWFNHWFSTAYHIINLMKQDERFHFYIIGSNMNVHSPVQFVCDEWYEEPVLNDENTYLEYCLKFCGEYAVDVFVPRRGMRAVIHNRALFGNTLVLAESDPKLYDLCNDKINFYNFIEKIVPQGVPEYSVIESKEQFLESYYLLRKSYDKICYKASFDEGASTFRSFDNEIIKALETVPGAIANYFSVHYAKTQKLSKSRWIIMPYIDGREVSVDMLRTAHGDIILPRFKIGRRYEKITYNAEITALCKTILDILKPSMPCNVQFRYWKNVPVFLDVNTRMSGGIQYACLSSSVNIPNIAVNKLMGIDKAWSINHAEAFFSYIENPLVHTGET